MKRILSSLLSAILLSLANCHTATAQDTANSDEITQGDNLIQNDKGSSGKFTPVVVDAGSSSDITLHFPASFANKTLILQPLDGGLLLIDGDSASTDANAALAFSFKVGDQPGTYRVLAIDPDGGDDGTAMVVALVQFQVPATQ